MALTVNQRKDTARRITRKHYGDEGRTANLSCADWEAAVIACDDWIEEHQSDFIASLPEPFKSASTAAEKRLLFGRIVMARVGLE
ncbi:MAG: hypothetical protein ACO1SX_19105 [Actinomycetota bacterium]